MINHSASETTTRHIALHAGATSLNQLGILLPGESKSGKSTLTLALLLRGCQYFSDEMAILDKTTLELLSFQQTLTLRNDVFCLFQWFGQGLRHRAWTSGATISGNPEAFLSVEEIRQGCQSQPCPVRFIIFPTYIPNNSVVMEPIRRGNAVLDLLRCCFDGGGNIAESIELLISVARVADCYRLTYGNAHEAAERILEAVGSILPDHELGERGFR